ncbi:LysR family transcriptional regulator [Ancylobacter terrae]|uniref:LysR family transcriptional regulator n=1 Tax=Ancylobacter sp. sgz301288 TaxID=3342077 RepID=UPI00385F0DF8
MSVGSANGVTLRQIRAFISVARFGAFTRAAEAIGLSQPALTTCIRHLEEQLGVALFERTTRRVELTACGSDFLPAAERIVRELDGAMSSLRAIHAGQGGRVTMASIASIASSVLPEALAAFKARYPNVGVDVGEDHSEGVRRKVLEGEAEFGLSGASTFEVPEIVTELLFSDPIGLFCRADHPLARLDRPLRWEDLSGQEIFNMGYETQIRSVAAVVPDVAIQLSSTAYKVRNTHSVMALIRQNDVIAALPLLSIPRSSLGELVFRPLTEPQLRRDILLCRLERTVLSVASRQLIAALLNSAEAAGAGVVARYKDASGD